jgi:threonylcarbamoyladenosine tRNA methylthiotransferase MtaB
MQYTFSIKTLGCKLNQYESSSIAGQLLENGWISRPFGETVDLVIVNTCTVTNKSDKKCRNYIRQGTKFSRTGRVLVTGCLVETESDSLMKIPGVVATVRNIEKENILSAIKKYYDIPFPDDRNDAHKVHREFPLPFYRTRGLIKIQDGCDGECSYCIVPNVRGNPVSRDLDDIIRHAERLISSGNPELILTGITIGKYNSNNKDLAGLIKKIIDIKGVFRVRISSIEPNHVSDELIDLFTCDKLCSHVHIPLQSGSDRILGLMKRPYSIRDYMDIIAKIRYKNNNIGIGTDMIIGFPYESEQDFRESLNAIEDAQFSYVHQFTFSRRKGTPAYDMSVCSNREISDRSLRMREISGRTGLRYRKKFLGRNMSSIIEKNKGKKGYTAVSGNYIKMIIRDQVLDDNVIGRLTDVRLDYAGLDENAGTIPAAS